MLFGYINDGVHFPNRPTAYVCLQLIVLKKSDLYRTRLDVSQISAELCS